MDPWPSVYTLHRGRLLKIWKGTAIERVKPAALPGTVVEIRRGEGFVVTAGERALLVTEVQPEGRRGMTADGHALGKRLQVGGQLGEPQHRGPGLSHSAAALQVR